MTKKTKPKSKPKPKPKPKPRQKAMLKPKQISVPVQRPPIAKAMERVTSPPAAVIPGLVILGESDIMAFQGRHTVDLTVANTGDRPIQVGSHCHFFEVNRALQFDREQAYGFRLQVPAGTAVRFEPGEEKHVTLVAIGGNRVAYGINGLTHGRLDDPHVRQQALAKAKELGFLMKGTG